MTQLENKNFRADPPHWLALATDLVDRLRLHHAGQTQRLSSALSRGAFDDDMADDPTLGEVFARFEAGQPRTETHILVPVTPIPARQLLTAIRLAAAFQTKAALAGAQERRALTVVTDLTTQDVDLICQVLKDCFPHPPWVLISPGIMDGAVSKSSAERFWSTVEAAMDAYTATLMIVPAGLATPAYLRHAGLPTHHLAPITADIVVAHLRAGELGDAMTDEVAFRQALPSDTLLAGLSTAETCTALRAPSLPDALARLAAMTQSDKTDAPQLEDMTGDSPALLAARRLVADLLLWKDGTVAWSDLSRSVLFYGPPGTGKTWLARAMGSSAGIACITASFAEWQAAGHLGDMLREMRRSFAEARRRAPCILFIDEIDAVGSRDSGEVRNSNYRTQVINAFLGEMNAIAIEQGVIVVGACNFIDRMDPAILRAGRFDIKVEVPLPDAAGLLGLLRRQLHGDIADPELCALARAAVGRSPAVIDAAIRAARSEARHQRTDLTSAMLRQQLCITTGAEHQPWQWRVALHEAGHAVVGATLGLGPIHSMKITDDGGEIRLKAVQTESLLANLEAEICYNLAGRAAERLVLRTISAGAGGAAASDLAKATEQALRIETVYGLGAEGPVWHDAPETLMLHNSHLRGRVRQRIERAEVRAGKILARHRVVLEALARDLLQDRSLNSNQIENHLRHVALADTPVTARLDSIENTNATKQNDMTQADQ